MVERFKSEVHSNGGRIVLDEIVVGEPDEQTRFADTGVSEQNDFEQIVVLLSSQLSSIHFNSN